MRIKVVETFRYEGKAYEEGSVVDLPDAAARDVIEKGYGEKVEEQPPEIEPKPIQKREIEDSDEGNAPVWKRKIWISEDRNLSISVWPPGGKFDSPSVTLEENRRDDSGDWESDRTYLPTGSNLVALSEHLKGAWKELQEMKIEKQEE